jgi:hypothetical protein
MKVNRIVFFCSTPFTKRDFKRFGEDILEENGFEVWFYDFSPIVFPKLYESCTFPDLFKPQNHFLFLTEGEALKAISEIPSDSLIINLLGFDSGSFKFFKAISKARIPYCVLAPNSIPVGQEKRPLGILKFMKKLFSLNMGSLKKIIYRPQFAPLLGIQRPEYCIVASEYSLEKNRIRYFIDKNTEILWAHPLDYDIYLESSDEEVKIPIENRVFLEPLQPMFRGDVLAMDYKIFTTVENYYPSLCKFFDHIEKQIDTKVEIAAHPKSDHPPNPEYYGRRKVLRGNTFEMLKNSKFIMAHMSNAIQLGILLKKPILFLTTRELKQDKRLSSMIKAFADSIGKTVINIDEPLNIDWEKELYVDEKIYDDCIDTYIKKKGSEKLNTWQILSNRLRNF